MDDVDPDMLEAFFEATEEWNTAVNMSNSMAFISQFGVSVFALVFVGVVVLVVVLLIDIPSLLTTFLLFYPSITFIR